MDDTNFDIDKMIDNMYRLECEAEGIEIEYIDGYGWCPIDELYADL